MAADVNALLDFLRQGFNQSGAITKLNDGTMSAPETNNINQYGPIPQQVIAPAAAAYDPASAPIDLNDFTGAGSVDQGAIQSQDNMSPVQAPVATPTQNKTTGMNKAQAKKADSAIGTEEFTKNVVNNPKPEMIALDNNGTSVSVPKVPTSNEAGFYGEEGPSYADPRLAANAAMLAKGEKPNKSTAAPTEELNQFDPNFYTNVGQTPDGAVGAGAAGIAGLLALLLSRGGVKPQAIAQAARGSGMNTPRILTR